jgi:hypothetical protein
MLNLSAVAVGSAAVAAVAGLVEEAVVVAATARLGKSRSASG